ncbi:glycine zipper 2TM domain-containing protein [Cognatishimia maritima]
MPLTWMLYITAQIQAARSPGEFKLIEVVTRSVLFRPRRSFQNSGTKWVCQRCVFEATRGKPMKKYALVLPIVVSVAACQTTTEQSTLAGAAAGAAIGASVSGDDDKLQGAIIGGAVGAAAGNYVGKANEPGQCIYTDRYGNQYVAACPS